MRKTPFLLSMDARRWRAVAVTLGLLASIAVVFLLGRTALGLDTEREVQAWLNGLAQGPWGLPAAIAVFTAAAFIGAPQFVLIAACVVAFGPWLGFAYSWIATVASAAVTFYAGRFAGRGLLRRFQNADGGLSGFVGRNAFEASFVIRNVPSAPFLVVNMAFGAAGAPFWRFLAGCALGILPKTALVTLFGRSFMQAGAGGDWRRWAIPALLGFAWLGVMLAARELLKRRERRVKGDD